MYTKKIVLVITFLSIIFFSGKAQFFFGLEGGYTKNWLHTDIGNLNNTKNKNGNGFGYGLLVKYDINKFLSLRTGIDLMQKSYSFFRTDSFAGTYETFKNSYLQVPLTTQIKAFKIKRIKLVFNVGIFTAYWLYAKVDGAIPNIFNSTNTIGSDGQITQYLAFASYSEKYQFNTNRDNRFEFGLTTGIGVYYKFNSDYSVFLESGYYQSFTDKQKKYMVNQISRFNQTVCISIGCLMRFCKNKK
jgi:hypothetical protein